VLAAEHRFLAVYDLSISSFVDFTSAVGADVQARLDGCRDEGRETFEESSAKVVSLVGEFINFPLLFSYWFYGVLHKAFLFEPL